MGRALLVAAEVAGLKVVARLYRERLPYQTGNTGLWSLPPTPGHSSSQGRKSSAATTHWVLCLPNPLSCSLSIKKACLRAVCPHCMCSVCVCMRMLCACAMHMYVTYAGALCVFCLLCVHCVCGMWVYYTHVCAIFIGSVCVR